jgi:multidrug efflux pump
MTDLTSSQRPRFTDVFVERPVLAVVIAVALILVGLRAATQLPILQFPSINSSSLQISTPYVGASAETVQGFITDPIERVAASVPGVDYVDAVTTAGFSLVTVWMKLNEDSTKALAELTARLNQIAFELPADAEDPAITIVRADRPYAAFYLDVALTEAYTRAEVTDFLTRRVNPLMAAIPGVQRVGIEGGRLPAMRIWLDPSRLAMFDLSASDVAAALRANNIISTLGRTESATQRVDLLSDTNLRTVDDFRKLVVRDDGDRQLLLGDVATIEAGEEEGAELARTNLHDVVYISVWPLPGSNEIKIADRMYEVVEQANAIMPRGLEIGIAYDATMYMRDALREIFITLIETVLLVGLVVVLFMGSFRTALVPLIAIPISLLGAFAGMAVVGFSLNLLTVLAIVLSVGLVVDDAIVVVENVARYMREGMSRFDAALSSSRQLLAPIIGMTITLSAVYAPIGYLSGLTGALFREFAFALAFAVLISGVVAITLSPIMSGWLAPEGGHEGHFTRMANSVFDRLQAAYARRLDKVLTATPQVLTLAIIFSLLVVPLYMFSQKELAPVEDQGEISVIIESAPEATIEYTAGNFAEAVRFMNSLPGATNMWQVLAANAGFGGQEFVPFDEREKSVHELLSEAYAGLSRVAGVSVFPVLPSALPSAGNFDVELVVMSADAHEQMLSHARAMVAAAFTSGKFMFASTDLRIDLPQGRFRLDRQRISDLGMTLEYVSDQLSILLSGNYVNRFDYSGKAYQVIPMIDPGARPDPERILDLKILAPAGDLVSLRALATLEKDAAPRSLGKFQQNNSFRVYGGLIPGVTKEQGLRALEIAARDLLPPGYSIDYAGESRQLRQEGNTMLGVLGIAVIFVFLVLAVQFNSLRDPLVVLLGSVPLALSGAMLIAFLDWTTINIYSQVGLITLVGLVAKNGILIVEFANKARELGRSKLEAIRESATTRLRPVLMTTGATVLGHFPLVLVSGAGAEARNSIGIILVAGMLIGSAFTLFVLPGVYMVFASERRFADSAQLDEKTLGYSAQVSAT